jgi:hypothetical protein
MQPKQGYTPRLQVQNHMCFTSSLIHNKLRRNNIYFETITFHQTFGLAHIISVCMGSSWVPQFHHALLGRLHLLALVGYTLYKQVAALSKHPHHTPAQTNVCLSWQKTLQFLIITDAIFLKLPQRLPPSHWPAILACLSLLRLSKAATLESSCFP